MSGDSAWTKPKPYGCRFWRTSKHKLRQPNALNQGPNEIFAKREPYLGHVLILGLIPGRKPNESLKIGEMISSLPVVDIHPSSYDTTILPTSRRSSATQQPLDHFYLSAFCFSFLLLHNIHWVHSLIFFFPFCFSRLF